MRAPGRFDQRDAMLAQMVEAFMAGDDARYREAMAWLHDYCADIKRERGLTQVGKRWYGPDGKGAWSNLRRRQAKQ